MQAIQTTYLGPTNHRPSRIKAVCAAGSLISSWDYDHNVEDNHILAAWRLAVKLGWAGKGFERGAWAKMENIVTGGLRDGSMIHVALGES